MCVVVVIMKNRREVYSHRGVLLKVRMVIVVGVLVGDGEALGPSHC